MATKFRDLQIGQRFDWTAPGAVHTSFVRRCVKTSTRKYETCDGEPLIQCKVGTINAKVYNVA